MLTCPQVESRKFLFFKNLMPWVTPLGCLVETRREARIITDSINVGPTVEHITLSAPAHVFVDACRDST